MSGEKPVFRAPSRGALRAAEARERRRRAMEDRLHSRKHGVMRILLLLFAGICVVGLMIDFSRVLSKEDERNTLWGRVRRLVGAAPVGLADDILPNLGKGYRYRDPTGFFSVEVPYGWWKREKKYSGFYNVVLVGPQEMDMSIHVVYQPGTTLAGLQKRLKEIEVKLEAQTHMEITFVGGRRMIKRTARLWRNKVLLLDFITGDLVHHVQFGVHPDLYDVYEPVFLKIMETYEPGQVLQIPTAEDLLIGVQ